MATTTTQLKTASDAQTILQNNISTEAVNWLEIQPNTSLNNRIVTLADPNSSDAIAQQQWENAKGKMKFPYPYSTEFYDRMISFEAKNPNLQGISLVFHFNHSLASTYGYAIEKCPVGDIANNLLEYKNRRGLGLSSLWLQIIEFRDSIFLPGNGNIDEIKRWMQNPANKEHLESICTLNLSHKNLKHLPVELGKFTKLKQLILNYNQLSSLPYFLSNLKELEEISIVGNQLTEIPAFLSALPKLKKLICNDNPVDSHEHQVVLQGAGLNQTAGLTKLKNNQKGRGAKEDEYGHYPPKNYSHQEFRRSRITTPQETPPIDGKFQWQGEVSDESIQEQWVKTKADLLAGGKTDFLEKMVAFESEHPSLQGASLFVGFNHSLNKTYGSSIASCDGSKVSEALMAFQEKTDFCLMTLWVSILQTENAIFLPQTPSEIRLWLKDPFSKEFIEKITEINICGMGLELLPPEISHFSKLETLNLAWNNLSGIPDSLSQCKDLECLDLERNQFSGIPKAVTDLSQLLTLTLSENQITEIPETVTDLKNIKVLRLSGNQIEKIPDFLSQLTKLRLLNLSKNKISEFPLALTESRESMNINLSHNPIMAEVEKNKLLTS